MAGEKVSIQQETTTTNGAWYYTIIPGPLGVYLSRKISGVNMFKPVTDRLTALENNQGNYATANYVNRSAPFTHTVAANSKIEAIDCRAISGSPVIKAGTTVGGEELFPEISVTIGEDSNNLIMKSFQNETIVYFTISGGSLNITITVKSAIL